ncbi:MAG: hypothetical protein II981_00935 [Bacteroidales bacterium]|nr:hypothetical protein [Bacteroidales bacterium]
MNLFISYIREYPVRLLHGVVISDGVKFPIYVTYSSNHEWGVSSNINIDHNSTVKKELQIELVWMSVVDHRIYCCVTKIDLGLSNINLPNFVITAGLSPNGEVVIWLQNEIESKILGILHGVDVTASIDDKIVYRLNLYSNKNERLCTLNQLYTDSRKLFTYAINDSIDIVVPKKLLQNRMQQFYYRYVFQGDFLDSAEFIPEKICLLLFDGTYSKNSNISLTQYHLLGKPNKLSVMWRVGVTEYSVHLWFDEQRVSDVFAFLLYGDIERTADLKFSLNIKRHKLVIELFDVIQKQSFFVPEEAYQFIVFRDGFEEFRSENYNQERGAWNW